MRVEVTITGAVELRNKLITAQRKYTGSKKPVLQTIAQRLAESVRQRLRAGDFTPPSEVTLKLRKGSGSAPLIDSGGMLASITTFVSDTVAAAGSTKTRAVWNQLGITTGADSMIPGKVVPPRPFILVSAADADWALEQLANFVFGEETRAAA